MSEVLDWDDIVDAKASEMKLEELCIATSWVDELCAEVDDLIHESAKQEVLEHYKTQLDAWILYLNTVVNYWGRFGKGPDNE